MNEMSPSSLMNIEENILFIIKSYYEENKICDQSRLNSFNADDVKSLLNKLEKLKNK